MSDMIGSTKSYIAHANMGHWQVLSQNSLEALSGSIAARFELIIHPAFENSLSAGVLSHKAVFMQFLPLQESVVRHRVNKSTISLHVVKSNAYFMLY